MFPERPALGKQDEVGLVGLAESFEEDLLLA
jgi:hypothetical protein